MLYAGIDIAKCDHVVGAVDERGRALSKPMPFKNLSSGFERCAAYLAGIAGQVAGRRRDGGHPPATGLAILSLTVN